MSSVPVDGIVELASRLVATPSCAGIDAPDAVLDVARTWLAGNGLRPRVLHDDGGRPVAVLVEIAGRAPGPVLCLDACIDTAPAGDRGQWTEQPFAGAVRGRRLLGRGAGDSKAGVAILAHVARRLSQEGLPRGAIHVLFDADEHTGRFGGVRAYLDAIPRPPDAASLGYPGNDCVVVGSRGFLRARITFLGKAEHSGAVERTGINALTKAAAFALRVAEVRLPAAADPAFPFGPAATVTRLEGGEGFSVVPDRATCHVDIRLTRTFDGASASRWLEETVHAVDRQARIETVDHWPAYLVGADAPLAQSFTEAASRAFGRPIPADVCGPSNIGNLLAARGVPTICAPGVSFGNMHAANEWMDIDSIAPVYAMYCDAALRFLSHLDRGRLARS
ncbi:MAG: M20 family metallopeptidase [Reyranella sp.]|uniref:M20 family metallopeptidase n=1 Tax=Reyranella sp. TaxID=1929291 RepID=UPI003D0BA3DC